MGLAFKAVTGDVRDSPAVALVEALLDQLKTGSVTLDQARQPDAAVVRSAPPNSETWIETPLLQMVLTRLWDEEKKRGSRRLRLATLNKLGGAPRILRTHLDKTMRKLKRRDRRMAVVHSGVTLPELVNNLNSLGVGPRDMISILQAIKAAGALQADIEMM